MQQSTAKTCRKKACNKWQHVRKKKKKRVKEIDTMTERRERENKTSPHASRYLLLFTNRIVCKPSFDSCQSYPRI